MTTKAAEIWAAGIAKIAGNSPAAVDEAAERTPARTKLEVVDTARTKNEAADVEVDVIQANEESADTTGWVYRCSCGQNFETSIALGGHRSLLRMDNVKHRSIGFGPPPKAAALVRKAAAEESADLAAPAELYVSDKDRGIVKEQDRGKGKKSAGEKKDRITTNIDEAAVIAVAPKEFRTSSILLWQARKIADNDWNWPKIG